MPEDEPALSTASPVGGDASSTGTRDNGSDPSSGAVKTLESGMQLDSDRQPLPPRIDASLLEFYRKLTHLRRFANAEACLDQIAKPRGFFSEPDVYTIAVIRAFTCEHAFLIHPRQERKKSLNSSLLPPTLVYFLQPPATTYVSIRITSTRSLPSPHPGLAQWPSHVCRR